MEGYRQAYDDTYNGSMQPASQGDEKARGIGKCGKSQERPMGEKGCEMQNLEMRMKGGKYVEKANKQCAAQEGKMHSGPQKTPTKTQIMQKCPKNEKDK